MRDAEDKFFFHFIAGSIVLMALLITPLIFMLLYAIWQQGIAFIAALAVGITAFSWITHKVAVFIKTKEDWL